LLKFLSCEPPVVRQLEMLFMFVISRTCDFVWKLESYGNTLIPLPVAKRLHRDRQF
jgi:hypothetical protein